jgi:heterodisulfide reductase subunit B
VNYSYYPGCSLHSTGLEFEHSTQAVFRHLGMELTELEGWNCCGASSAHALSHTLALTLPARNLALAQKAGSDLIMPCAACYNRMKTADYVLRNDKSRRAEIENIVGFQYTGNINVRPVLGVIYEDYGTNRIASSVKRPLTGLKIVPYYGCLLVRPPEIAQFDNPENPRVMTKVLSAAGAQVMEWSYTTDCCGAGLSLSRFDLVEGLVSKLAEHAREAGADAMVTGCPLCQVNLEMRQMVNPKLPAFYFTELLGLAFDLPEANKWWSKHLIDPRPILHNAGLA